MTAIRWHQRLANLRKAFAELQESVHLSQTRELTKLEKQGLIQTFEYTHELAWSTLKDFLVDQGITRITGSKDATREAFKLGIIQDGEGWMDMIASRKQTYHTYNQETADRIAHKIQSSYFALFQKILSELESRKQPCLRNLTCQRQD